MEICSILTHAVISNDDMLQSFPAKIFFAHAALTTLSDITNNLESRLMGFRKVKNKVRFVQYSGVLSKFLARNVTVHSFPAKIFPVLAALTSLSDITCNSKLTSVFRKVSDLFDTQARLATFLARNVTLFFSQSFFPRLPH